MLYRKVSTYELWTHLGAYCGFVVAGSSDADIAVYQLNPKGVRTETPPPE
jgi:hypothetical protein